jgi:autotransporter-associated beta strand protein
MLADSGSVTVNSGGTFKVSQNETIASLNGSGTVSIAAVRSLRLSSGDFSGALNGSGDLYKTGADTFTLSGTSALTGSLYLQNGTLVANSTTALNANNYVLMSAGSTFTANQNLVLGSISQNGGTIDGSGVITAVSTITRSGAINGVLGDVVGYNSGLLKLGTGTTTLGAANTYTGTTKVHEGTLKLGANGSLAANSSAQVGYEGTLDLGSHNQTFADVWANTTIAGSGTMTVTGTLNGSGTINADTVVTGIHSPGNSPGIQTFDGNLTYQSGAGILLEFADNTTVNSQLAYDQILVGGDLNFSGLTSLNISFGEIGSAVDWNNAFWQTSQSWTLYSVSGLTTGFDYLTLNSTNWSDINGLFFSDVLAGGNFSLALGQNGKDIVLNYAIPEPSTYALMGLGALALVIAYRRKRA